MSKNTSDSPRIRDLRELFMTQGRPRLTNRLILNKDESVTCSAENLKSICEKFLPKFHYSTLQLQDGSVGPTKLEWEIIYQRLVVEKRGGLCYERDEVLWQLLNKIGFEVWGEELCKTLIKWGASSQWSSSLYCLLKNSD